MQNPIDFASDRDQYKKYFDYCIQLQWLLSSRFSKSSFQKT